jgi:hypothetical protein
MLDTHIYYNTAKDVLFSNLFDKRQSPKLSLTPITKYSLADSMMSEQMSLNILYSQCSRYNGVGNHLLVRVGVFSMSSIKRDITLVNYMRRCVGSLNGIVRYIWMFLIFKSTIKLVLCLNVIVKMVSSVGSS